MSSKPSQPIGQLNGHWSLLLRVNLVVLPVGLAGVIGLNAWIVRNIHAQDVRLSKLEEWKSIGPRFTAVDAALLESRLKEWHHVDLDQRLKGTQYE